MTDGSFSEHVPTFKIIGQKQHARMAGAQETTGFWFGRGAFTRLEACVGAVVLDKGRIRMVLAMFQITQGELARASPVGLVPA